MLLDILIISLIIALLRGGKIERLAEIKFRKVVFIITPFILQYALVEAGEREVGWLNHWGIYIHYTSYILLLVGIWYNRGIKEMRIFGAGILLNFLVITANNGQMPVSMEALEKAGMQDMLILLQNKSYVIHTLMVPGTKLKFLADVIPLPPPYPRPRVLSIGDVIMGAGVFLLIQNYMLGKPILFRLSGREKNNADKSFAGKNARNGSI